jgi:hypothetical protein
MGFGLLCGLIADSRASLSTGHAAKSVKAKAPRPRVSARSSIFRFRDTSLLPSGAAGGSFAFARRPNPAARFDAIVFSEQAIPSFTNSYSTTTTTSEHGPDLANGEQSLLPAMMSLLAQAIGHGVPEMSEPNHQNQMAESAGPLSREPYDQVHQVQVHQVQVHQVQVHQVQVHQVQVQQGKTRHNEVHHIEVEHGEVHPVSAVGNDWVQIAKHPVDWPGEDATDLSSRELPVVRSSPLILKELAEMSAAYKENVEETAELIGLLEQMSKLKLAENESG